MAALGRHGIHPLNSWAISLSRFRMGWLWHSTLERRSQTSRVTWERMRRLFDRWLSLELRGCHGQFHHHLEFSGGSGCGDLESRSPRAGARKT